MSRPPPVARSRRGSATVVALFLLGLVAAAMAVATTAAVADLRRTRDVATAAQLRQLLLAGGLAVADHARRWPATAPSGGWSVAVPVDGFRLSVSVDPGGSAAVVTATGNGHRLEQRLSLASGPGGWRVTAAALDGR